MVTYFKSQRDFAKALISLIDIYWENEISEPEFINRLRELASKNEEKLFGSEDYNSIVKQRLGKRRIELLNKVLTDKGVK